MNQNLKSLLMIAAIFLGALLPHTVTTLDIATAGMLSPVLLFMMLFITFCCVDLRDLRFSMLHVWIMLFQLVTAVGSYYLLLPFGEIMAQGVMVCFLMPVAMAAVVVGRMLGAKVVTIASFSMICNIVISLFVPLFFAHIGSDGCTFSLILAKVAPLTIVPPFAAQTLRCLLPAVTSWFGGRGYISYYLWLISLVISIGRTVTFVFNNLDSIDLSLGLALALGSLVTCIIQYKVGGILGDRYGDHAAGQQSLGQKNTILAIWMTQSFLSPVASIAPTAYVLWQNFTNSYKIFRYKGE